MRKIFEDGKDRAVPKCKECSSDKDVYLATYNLNNEEQVKYWECSRCGCVVRKARY